MEQYKVIERSIIKKYRKEIWGPFVEGINDYDLIQEGDRIAVCISGGKDSMLMAKCMQELKRHGKIAFDLEFIVMNPGYNDVNRQRIIDNAELMNIPIKIFQSDIYKIVNNMDDSPCYLCARMRRGYLYRYAQEVDCNKIALGHHFDDVIETVLMSILYSGEYKTMMPKLHSTNFKGLELIRPMYKVKEADIIAWKNYNHLDFIQCACPLTENSTSEDYNGGSKRDEMKALIETFRQTNSHIDQNIFASTHNVNLETVIGYRKNGHRYNFLDEYDSDNDV